MMSKGETHWYCRHGNRRDLGICPDCDAEKMTARQRRADRAAFRQRIDRILGKVK